MGFGSKVMTRAVWRSEGPFVPEQFAPLRGRRLVLLLGALMACVASGCPPCVRTDTWCHQWAGVTTSRWLVLVPTGCHMSLRTTTHGVAGLCMMKHHLEPVGLRSEPGPCSAAERAPARGAPSPTAPACLPHCAPESGAGAAHVRHSHGPGASAPCKHLPRYVVAVFCVLSLSSEG